MKILRTLKNITFIESLVILLIALIVIGALLPKSKPWEWKAHELQVLFTETQYEIKENASRSVNDCVITALNRRPEMTQKTLAYGRLFINPNRTDWEKENPDPEKDRALFGWLANSKWKSNCSFIYWNGLHLIGQYDQSDIISLSLWEKNPPIEITPISLNKK